MLSQHAVSYFLTTEAAEAERAGGFIIISVGGSAYYMLCK